MRKNALLIGIGNDLPATINDVRLLGDVLESSETGDFAGRVRTCIEGDASRAGIQSALASLEKELSDCKSDLTLVYFSGHGGHMTNASGEIEYFLVPNDYDPRNHSDSSFSGKDFCELVSNFNCERLIVFFDCCHAGGIPKLENAKRLVASSSIPVDEKSLESLRVAAKLIVGSSQDSEYSYISGDTSVFTSTLVEALSADPPVTKILDLLVYLFENVPERAAGPQHPLLVRAVDLLDNFPLVSPAQGATETTNYSEERSVQKKGISNARRQRVNRQLDDANSEWSIYNEQISRLKDAIASETDVLVIFKYEKSLLEKESKISEISRRISDLEEQLT